MAQKWFRSAKSGLYLPMNELPAASKATMTSYADVAKQAAALQSLFTKYKKPLSAELAQLCSAATDLAAKWEENRTSELSPNVLWQALALNRIANAVLRLDGHPRAAELIEKLGDGDISMIGHNRTVARDFFWEIEFWHFMKRVNLDGELIDPPDIVWDKAGQKTAIACKRIYSEKHIQNVLSEAVHQIEGAGGFGIAAFQLEDARVPKSPKPDQITRLEDVTMEEASAILQRLNQDFLRQHERHFQKYFTKDRLSAALVATSCFAVIGSAFVNTQWMVWTHPDLSSEHKERVMALYDAIVAGTQ